MAGEHHVEDDEIGLKVFESSERAIFAAEDLRLKARARQVVFDQRGKLGFILNDGYFSGHMWSIGQGAHSSQIHGIPIRTDGDRGCVLLSSHWISLIGVLSP